MPQSMDGLVASGAGDGRVKIHRVECDHRDGVLQNPSFQCRCHAGRVKRLATAPDVPYLLWSGAEDGTVMQFDLRAPHNCSDGPSQILVNLLCHAGNQAEVSALYTIDRCHTIVEISVLANLRLNQSRSTHCALNS